MQQQFLKYPINAPGTTKIEMPSGAAVMHVGLDGTGRPCVWAIVDLEQRDVEVHQVNVFGTGWNLPPRLEVLEEYLGTITRGEFVWHVFEKCESLETDAKE